MRIIAGQWRGRRLTAPAGATTRPTADRARETLFSMLASRLGSFAGLRVADMFAGSGALGLEALSRGAAAAVLVERNPSALSAIRANVRVFEAVDAKIVAADAARAVAPFACDLIFADPPYRTLDWPAFAAGLSAHGWINASAMLAFEEAAGVPVDLPYERIGERRVGAAALHLFKASG